MVSNFFDEPRSSNKKFFADQINKNAWTCKLKVTKLKIEELKCATYWPILTSSKSNKSEERLFLVGNGPRVKRFLYSLVGTITHGNRMKSILQLYCVLTTKVSKSFRFTVTIFRRRSISSRSRSSVWSSFTAPLFTFHTRRCLWDLGKFPSKLYSVIFKIS